MRQIAVILSLIIALAYPGSAFAGCNTPTWVAFGSGYWEYEPSNNLNSCSNTSCWSFTSSLSCGSGNMSCGYTGWCATAMYQQIGQSFTVGASDSGTNTWEAFYTYDLNSPGAYWFDQIQVQVQVYHNGQYYTYSSGHNGTQGNVSCGGGDTVFTAYNGDTVSVYINMSRSDPASKVCITNFHIWRHSV
jgi:hypothetical protein